MNAYTNFMKYACLFLAIIGINVNVWAAASTGEVVIFPNGTTTVNRGDWQLAGAPTSYNDGSAFTLELNDKYYPVTLYDACDNGNLYPENPLGLQVKKNGGYFEMVIQSTAGVTVEIEYSSTSDMTMSLTGVKDDVVCAAGDAQTQTINTNTTEATLRIAAGSSVGYLHYVKLMAKGASGTIGATGSAAGRPGIHPAEKTISKNVFVDDMNEINVTVNYDDISDLSGGYESYYLDLRINDEDDEDQAIAEVVAEFDEVTSSSATLNITYEAKKAGTYTSTLHLYGYKTGSWSDLYTFDIPLTLTVTGAEHTITLGTPEHGSVSATPSSTAQYTQVVSVTATPDIAGTPKYELDHWDVYKTGDESTKVTVTDGEFVMPDYDVTVSAVFRPQIIWGNYQTYCPVYLYFDDNDDENEATNMPTTQKGKKGFTATEPVSAPTIVGKTFVAWYESGTYEGEPFDFASTITTDKTLYAKWSVNTHTLTLVKGEGDCSVVTENIAYGTEVTIEANSECFPENKIFASWTVTTGDVTLSSTTTNPATFTMPDEDVVITANYKIDVCTVTYHTGLEGATTQTVEATIHNGDVLTEVQLPTPTGCGRNVFAGWAIGEFANTDNLSTITKYEIGTPVTDNMELHAIWQNGKSEFTRITTDGDPGEGTYILVDPTSRKALSATLAPTPVTIVDNKISTDEAYIQWTMTKTANGYSIYGIDGYLNITADKTSGMALSDAVVDTWNIAESSSNGVYNVGITLGGSDRRVCYISKKDKWLSYKNRTSGNLYKLTGDGPSIYTMDGFCPHIYHATGVNEMTSGAGVSVLAQENGLIIVENTSVVPVAQKVSGDDVFVVTVNPESTGTNGDGSLNYVYTVKFTPTAGNQTYTATYKFIGNGETEDEKHIASEAITFTGYSLPDEFAIVVNRGGQYYALPGGIASASTPNAVPVTVVGGEVVDLGSSDAYHVHTGAVSGESARTTLRLVTSAGALWATNADNANINDYNGDLTSKTTAASTTNTQWTLERYYRESDDEFMGYHLSSDANAAKALFFQSTNGHWGYYSNSYYSGGAYNGEIFFLPIASQFGDMMDIVEWNSNSVVLNMNGYGATAGKWGVKNASDEMLLAANRAADRTLEVSTAALVADKYLNIKVYGNANNAPAEPVVESNRNYKIPHVMEGAQTISSAASFSATSILYVKSGTTTVNVNLTVAKVVVCPGAELVVASDKRLTTTDLVLRTKAWQAAAISGNFTATNTHYTRIVTTQKYQQFGLPLASSIDEVRLSNGKTTPYGSTWLLNSYDGQRRANSGADGSNWTNLADQSTIAANTGYEMWSNSNYYREFYFPVNPTAMATTVHATAYSGTADVQHQGWNALVAPKMSRWSIPAQGAPSEQMKISELVDYDTYWQHIATNMQPALPFYIQVAEDVDLSFNVASSVAARQAVKDDVQEQWIQLNYENAAGLQDEANMFIHPTKFSPEYEVGYDVAKMTTSGSRPQIYSQLACGNLAFAAVPDSLAETMIPLAVYTPEAGEMTFSLTENEYLTRLENVYLLDQNVIVADLLSNNYTYSAEAGTAAGRFYLMCVFRKLPQTPTDINSASGVSDIRAKKVFYRDHIYIVLPNGHVWDATGKTVK